MLQIQKKMTWMALLWFIIILLGMALTIYGGLKLNDEWTKNDTLRQIHLIPDFLLMDFEVMVELDSTLTDKILKKVKKKTNVPNGGIEDLEQIPLAPFFNEKLYKENKAAKDNYKLDKDIYNEIRGFDILANSTSKDSTVQINLVKNTNKIIFTQQDGNLKDSYIEVREYAPKTNKFKIFYHNIQLNVEFLKQSKFITDLDKGNLEIVLIMGKNIEVKELKNIKIKTRSTEYFNTGRISYDSLRYNTELNLLLR